MKPIKVHCRWMITRDRPEVLEIERDAFGSFAWDEGNFRAWLSGRHCIGMVSEYDGRAVGYMVYEIKARRLDIVNLAVAVGYRRAGVGSQMLAKLIGKLSLQRRNRIRAEVRETNTDAQLFFRSQGFRAVSVLHDFYEDTDDDAYLMQYRIGAGERIEA